MKVSISITIEGLNDRENDSLAFSVVKAEPILGSKRADLLKGLKVSYQLKDNYVLTLKLQGKSMHGNPVDFTTEAITVKSSDETILSVSNNGGEISVTPVGPLGTAQVQVTIPSVQVNNQPLGGNFDVQVIAGDPDSVQFTPETTVAESDPILNPPAPAPAPAT